MIISIYFHNLTSTNSFDKRIKAEDFNRSLNVEPSADHRIQEHVINRTCDLQ